MTSKGQYHEYVNNLTYAAIGLTTVRREVVFITFRTFCDVPIGHHWSRHEYARSGGELQLINFLHSFHENPALKWLACVMAIPKRMLEKSLYHQNHHWSLLVKPALSQACNIIYIRSI